MSEYSRIVVTGSKGMLGSRFCALLNGHGEVMGVDLPEADISDRRSLRRTLLEFAPQLIIHCAAYTQVDKAELEVEQAFLVNALATRWIAQISAELSACLVYFSTDYVFCDTPGATPRNEFTQPAPRGVYACSKYGGELAVRECLTNYFIIRTSWLYGPGGRNFIDAILEGAECKPYLQVVCDQVGCPTYTVDLASTTMQVVEHGDFGTYHISGKGCCSWYEFAKEILKTAGISKRIYPISTEEYNALAPRPKYSVLDHFALRQTIGDHMPHWKESLVKFIKIKQKDMQNIL